ncbi:HAMP domain-containing protein, partial [Frankia sp. Cpl3]|nr:HAMP domain-containing protein [Frankia sp. Cpl3]
SSGTTQASDFRGEEVLVSYDRVKAGNFTWAILAEMDMTEIMTSPNRIRNAILLFDGVVLVVIVVIAYFTASGMRRSITKMVEVTERMGKGDFLFPLDPKMEKRKDELGEMARSLQVMRNRLNSILSQVQQAAVSLTQSTQEIRGNA